MAERINTPIENQGPLSSRRGEWTEDSNHKWRWRCVVTYAMNFTPKTCVFCKSLIFITFSHCISHTPPPWVKKKSIPYKSWPNTLFTSKNPGVWKEIKGGVDWLCQMQVQERRSCKGSVGLVWAIQTAALLGHVYPQSAMRRVARRKTTLRRVDLSVAPCRREVKPWNGQPQFRARKRQSKNLSVCIWEEVEEEETQEVNKVKSKKEYLSHKKQNQGTKLFSNRLDCTISVHGHFALFDKHVSSLVNLITQQRGPGLCSREEVKKNEPCNHTKTWFWSHPYSQFNERLWPHAVSRVVLETKDASVNGTDLVLFSRRIHNATLSEQHSLKSTP